jgi:hypothetical protein
VGNTRIPKRSTEWNIPWKKTCGKTTAEMGRHQKGLFVADEYKRMVEANRGQEHL